MNLASKTTAPRDAWFWLALIAIVSLSIVAQHVRTQPEDVRREVLSLQQLVIDRTADRLYGQDFKRWTDELFRLNPELKRPNDNLIMRAQP